MMTYWPLRTLLTFWGGHSGGFQWLYPKDSRWWVEIGNPIKRFYSPRRVVG